MKENDFLNLLNEVALQLTREAKINKFVNAFQFENRVRELISSLKPKDSPLVDFDSKSQAFPDIAFGKFGIEVKFTTSDSWRCIANSVRETQRHKEVKKIFLLYGKMGGEPDVRISDYADSIIHVRTSHVPRFEVEIGNKKSLFEDMKVSYDDFQSLNMSDKMHYIRKYARKRLRPGEHLWWLEENSNEDHSLPLQVRLYTELSNKEKQKLRAEAILLNPQIVKSGRAKHKYDGVAMFMLTYHGILCHQTRDMFTAGSVGDPNNKREDKNYIRRMLQIMAPALEEAAASLNEALFIEYWEEKDIPTSKEERLKRWLEKADAFAAGTWQPSKEIFKNDLSSI